MPEIKQTILSNVSRAMGNANQSPQEKIQENLLTSVNSNLKRMVKHNKKREKQDKVLTSIDSNIRRTVKQGRQRDRYGRFVKRQENKHFKSVRDLLTRIKKNTKPQGKGMGILKFLLFMFAGILIKTVKGIWKAVKFLGGVVKKVGIVLKNWAKNLFSAFKKTKFGKWLRGVQVRFLRFFKNMRRAWKSGKGIIGGLGKIFRGIQSFFGRGLKLLKSIKSFAMGLKNVKVLGTILKLIGNVSGLIVRFNPIMLAVKGWFNVFKGIFTGAMKVVSWVGKGLIAIKNFFKPALGIGKLIGNFLSGFGKVGGMLAKVGGILGRGLKVLPVIGQVIMVVMTIVDGIIGFFKAGKYFDKAKGESVTIGERISAVIGSIFSGLTFGLLGDGKKWANRIFDSGKWIADKFVATWDWIKTAFTKVSDIVGATVEIVKNSFNFISDIVMKLGSLIWEGIKMYVDFVYIKPFNFLLDSIKGLWKLGTLMVEWVGGFVSSIWNSVKEAFISSVMIGEGVYDAITGWMRNLGGHIWGSIKSMFMNSPQDETKGDVIGAIATWGKNLLTSIWEGIKSIFSSDKEEGEKSLITSAMDALSGLKDQVISGVKNFIMKIIDGIGSILNVLKMGAGKVVTFIKDLFSSDEESKDIKPKTESAKIKKIESIEQAGNIAIDETATDTEKTKMFMTFLMTDFADVMAKKIGAVTTKKGLSSVSVPIVKII